MNEYYGSFWLYNQENIITIDPELNKILKELEWEIAEGGYYVNNHIISKNNGKFNKKSFLETANLIQLYVRCFDEIITQKFIEKYDVKEYHINLIKRMYFDGYIDTEEKTYVINIGYKRPYGNSNVYEDIREECRPYFEEDFEDKLDEINLETYNILLKSFKELDYEYLYDFEKIGYSGVRLGEGSKRRKLIKQRSKKLNKIKDGTT